MREIKFRQYIGCTDKKFHLFGQNDGVWMAPCLFDFDKNPLEQYTGLKDKNDKEVYEGDILFCEFHNTKSLVEFKNGAFTAEVDGYYNDALGCFNSADFEVIGNIHENPELLK